jgi:chromosome partitioning protein
VVADLTNQHYLDTSDFEALFREEQASLVDEKFVVPPPPDGVAQADPEPLIGPTGRPWPDLPTPPPLTEHGPALIIAMCNQKGGVGKTTTTINLGAALAELGRHVLLVDFDPQGSLSVGLGVNPHTLPASIYNLLMGQGTSIDDVIRETNVHDLDILPSNIDLSAAEIQLVSEVAREQTLLRLLEAVRSRYDVILIDCAPSLGLLTINALTAADWVLMPLECEFFALRGIALLTDTIAKVQDRLNPRLEILGILGTMYDPRTLHSREVLERVVQAFGDQVFHTVIRRTVKFPETTVAGGADHHLRALHLQAPRRTAVWLARCWHDAAWLSSGPGRIRAACRTSRFRSDPPRREDHCLHQRRRALGVGAGAVDATCTSRHRR